MAGNLLAVIENLYAGVMDEDAWGRALTAIADLVSAQGLLLMSCNPQTCEIFRYELPGLDGAGLQEYGRHWIHHDPRYAAGLLRPVGEVQVDDMLVPRTVMRRSAIFNEFLRPWDIPFCIASWVIRAPTHGVTMCIEGTRRHGPFTEAERRKIITVLPHLRRVLQVKDRLAKAGTRADQLLETMDRLPYGVLLLDEDLTIVEASAAARAILAEGDGVHARGGRLGFHRSSDAAAFARTLTARPDSGPGSHGVVVVQRSPRLRGLTMLTLPLKTAPGHWTRPPPCYLVFMFDGSRNTNPSLATLRQAYGLTPGEAQLVVALVGGSSLVEIAAQRAVSVQTLRSQLKSVFAKTGARSQAQLLRLVLTGPYLLDAAQEGRPLRASQE